MFTTIPMPLLPGLLCNFVDPSLSLILGHVTFFGQWDVSKFAASISLKVYMHFYLLLCMAGLARLHLCLPWEHDWASCWRDVRYMRRIWVFLADWPVDLITWVSPVEISQASPIGRNTQSTQRLMKSNKCCCFKPLGFGVVYYMQ